MKKIFIIVLVLLLFLQTFLTIPYMKSLKGISILGYHGVVEEKDKHPHYHFSITKTMLEKHFKYFKKHNYKTLTLDEFYLWHQNKLKLNRKCVVLTFDDGFKNMNTIVKPLLIKYNFKATSFVIGKHIKYPKKKFLNKNDIKNNKYISYYSHSHNLHRKAFGFDKKIIETLHKDKIDKDFKEGYVNHKYFCFPYGRKTKGIDKILRNNNVKMAFTYNNYRHANKSDHVYSIPRYMILDITPMFIFKMFVK